MVARRAFSLLELLVAGALLALLIALTAVNMRSGRTRAESHGLALEIAQELRSARERAVAQGVPVAVVFPSNTGSRPISQGFLVLEGESQGKPVKQIDLSGTYDRAAIFVGQWSVSPGANQKQPVSPLATNSMIPLQSWLPAAHKTDYCFVFGPDGRLRTNDLTCFAGAAHLLVVNGVHYSAAAPPPGAATVAPPPAYFSPTRVGSPWTITVSYSGEVSLAQGVLNNSSLSDETQIDYPVPPATPPPAAIPGPQAPVITSLDVRPQVNPLTLPPGCDATVPLDGHLSVVLTAEDSDADQLYCEWTANGGAFSSASQDRMVWDVASSQWRAEWQWRPPGAASVGDQFSLTYRVFDSDGQVAAPFGAAILTVETSPVHRLAFSRESPPGTNADIWVVNSDGTGLRNLTNTPAVNESVAMASADGTKITYFYGSSGNVFVMNSDGTGSVQLLGGAHYNPVVSPLGNLMTFTWRAVGADYQVWGMLPDGTNQHFIADMTYTGGLGYQQSGMVSFSPDGLRVVYPKMDSNWELYTVNIDASSPTPLVTTPGNDQKPVWGDDGWIWFVTDQDGNNEIYKIRDDGTGLTRVTNDPGEDLCVSVSPDLTKIVVDRGGDVFIMNADGTGAKQVTSGPENDFRPIWLR